MNNLNPTVGIMYFSPTGTTRRICEEIAKAMAKTSPIRMDITRAVNPDIQNLDKVDIWVVGVPVYASRMPSLANVRISNALDCIPKKTPAIAVSVYGNVDA
jgi:flavodoxin